MSKYTSQLRYLIDVFGRPEVESWFANWNLSDYLTPAEINVVNQRGTFNKDYLIEQIVDRYYMREIGFETAGLFRHYCKVTMREIMGRYAQIIYSAAIEFDPLVNENYTETFNRNANSEGENTTTSSGSGFGVQSDTPQTNINKDELLAGSYASNTQADSTEGKQDVSGTNKEHEDYLRAVKGNRGISSNAPYLIEQYRNYIIPIYDEIIKECNVLFMNIY